MFWLKQTCYIYKRRYGGGIVRLLGESYNATILLLGENDELHAGEHILVLPSSAAAKDQGISRAAHDALKLSLRMSAYLEVV